MSHIEFIQVIEDVLKADVVICCYRNKTESNPNKMKNQSYSTQFPHLIENARLGVKLSDLMLSLFRIAKVSRVVCSEDVTLLTR